MAAGLAAWAWTMPGVEPEESPGIGAMLRALGRPAVLIGFWVFTLPALFSGVDRGARAAPARRPRRGGRHDRGCVPPERGGRGGGEPARGPLLRPRRAPGADPRRADRRGGHGDRAAASADRRARGAVRDAHVRGAGELLGAGDGAALRRRRGRRARPGARVRDLEPRLGARARVRRRRGRRGRGRHHRHGALRGARGAVRDDAGRPNAEPAPPARRSAPSRRSSARARCRSAGTASARACPGATRARPRGRRRRRGCARSSG